MMTEQWTWGYVGLLLSCLLRLSRVYMKSVSPVNIVQVLFGFLN